MTFVMVHYKIYTGSSYLSLIIGRYDYGHLKESKMNLGLIHAYRIE